MYSYTVIKLHYSKISFISKNNFLIDNDSHLQYDNFDDVLKTYPGRRMVNIVCLITIENKWVNIFSLGLILLVFGPTVFYKQSYSQ